ncbi:MAG: hypothetical protein ABJQ29_15215 [Luteolibacter sp.]
MKKLISSLLLLCLAAVVSANDQMRQWTMESGDRMEGEILAYDEEEKVVTLRLADGTEVRRYESDFSVIDRAWILEWLEKGEEDRAKLAEVGGTVTEHTGTGKFTTEYAVFTPAGEAPEAGWPMMILFHPGGNGRRQIYRYIEAAAAVNMTVVSLDIFRNTDDNPEREAALLERFKELLPQIEATVAHDPQRIYMGGVSGGSWRGYHYAAQVPRPWAGIFANGGWLGGQKYYHLPYPAMRVAMVNGDKDHANRMIAPDTERLHEAGCIVSVHAFEGGHQLAPPSVQEKAFRWLLSVELPQAEMP